MTTDVSYLVKNTLSVLSKIVNKDFQDEEEKTSEADVDIALDCFVKLFTKVQLSDHMGILSFAVDLLTVRPTGEALPVQNRICDTLVRLILGNDEGIKERYGKWKEIITNVLVTENINIFKAVDRMFLIQASHVATNNQKVVSCVTLIKTLLDSNVGVKKSFDKNFGMNKFQDYLKLHANMTKEIADALLDLLTISNKPVEIEQRVITLTGLLPILIDLMPYFDDEGQRVICEKLRVMCATRLQNRLICSDMKLTSKVLLLIDDNGDNLSIVIKDCLISIMEILGCLSLPACEFKSLISLVQRKGNNSQFSHSDRLVQSLERMASQNAQYQPQYFIDFYDIYSSTYIKCPSIQRWNGKGITVHTWVCLDFTLPDLLECRHCKVRHVLYSFLNSRGEGFEAFFTQDGFLVIAVHTKKEYLTTTVTSAPFTDQEWHGLTIVHTKKILGRASVSVYVDGHEIHSAPLQFPSVNREISHSYIGHCVKSDSKFHYQKFVPSTPIRHLKDSPFPECVAAGQQNQLWGIPGSLKGQMASFILFNESLPIDKIIQLSTPGPNYHHLFTPKDVLTDMPITDTAGLLLNVIFCFNAKASVGQQITDLQQNFKEKIIPNDNLHGSVHHVWSIQEAIQSLGGLSVLFPLLEQACFKITKKVKHDTSTLSSDSNVGPDDSSSTDGKIDDELYVNMDDKANNSSNLISTENKEQINRSSENLCSLENKNTHGSTESMDTVDSKAKLSDIPILYSPKHHNNASAGVIWNEVIDSELESISVAIPSQDIKDSVAASVNTYCKSDSEFPKHGSFVVLGTGESKDSQTSISTDWTMLEKNIPRTRSQTYKNWAKQNNHELNGVAHFIALIRYLIASKKQNPDMALELQGIKVVGLLLQDCDPNLINIGFLNCVAQLIESLLGVKDVLLEAVYQYILFDFQIWYNTDLSVQIAHTQLLHTYIKEDPDYFSRVFGINFFIHVIEHYYTDRESSKELRLKGEFRLSESEERDLRKALLGLIFYFLKLNPSKENVHSIIIYMANLSKHEHLDELLDLLGNVIKTSDSGLTIGNLLADTACYVIYRWLVHDIPNKTRLKIFDIVNFIIQHCKLSDAVRRNIALKQGLFPAIGELLCKQDVDRDVVVQLLKFGLSHERSLETKTDIYKDFSVVLAVVRITHFLPRPVKLEVAIKIRHSLKLAESSAYHCVRVSSWYEPLWKLLLKENNSSSDMDVMEAELVQVIIEIIHIVMWCGIDGADIAAWTQRTEPITSLHILSSNYSFLLPALVIERQLYERCLEACTANLLESGQPFVVDSQNAVQILKLLEVFLSNKEICDPERHKWSSKLIENIFNLLDALNAWQDSAEDGCEWVEVLQIVERILYQSFHQSDKDLLELANYKLAQLLNKRVLVGKEEASYQFYHINQVLITLQKMDISCETLLLVLLQRFERFGPYFFMIGHLPNLPTLKPGSFKKEFLHYMKETEYQKFMGEIKEAAFKFEYDTFSESPLAMDKLWMESMNAMTDAVNTRQRELEESLQSFSRMIYYEFDERRNEERDRLADYQRSYSQRNRITRKLWEYQKRFLTSERGAWFLRNKHDRHFKLSNTENRYRMRLKLTENMNFNSHTDAARQRDVSDIPDKLSEANLPSLPVSMDSDVVLSDNEEDEEEEVDQAQGDIETHLYDLPILDGATGSHIFHTQCCLITLMDVIPGRIELTSTHVCFYDERNIASETMYDFRFTLEELREIYSRMFNLRKTAMEFFLLDRSSYFVNFNNSKDKETFYRKVTARSPKNLYYSGIQNPAKLLRVSKLTNKWVDREISNFEYIMQLNTISGRTYNDLAQYPVFPWVLTDYKSDTINLQDESVYRDLSKPVGALNPKRAKEIKIRFDTFIDVSGLTQKSHYFTHYSNPGGVLHYLVRVDPFTSLHVHLQGGRFDCADRQFYSIETAWNTIMNGSDVKELIPEFYFFPEFLINMNSYSFGHLQRNGERVDDVIIPPWAKDAHDFINIHRQALESEYVSANLHSWIDLIFGYKQRGKEAEKALNVFSHYSYEGAVDLDKIEDPVMREAIEGMINNFGQTPTQLLKRPHPKRKTLQEVDTGRLHVVNYLENASFSLIEIQNEHMNSPVVFIAPCKPRPKSIRYHAVPDSLVTVHLNGLFGIHDWLPFADAKTQSFSFTMDVLLASAASHNQRALPGIMSPSLELSSKLFAFTGDGHLMISCGYWDNTIRLVSTDRGRDKLKACVSHHNDVVTCISLDVDGSHLISGSADLTCAVWKIEQTNGFSSALSKEPVQTLYGHDACITAVVMYSDLDLAVSGDKDGICLIHTLRRGIFVHSLTPTHAHFDNMKCHVIQIKLSEQGRIVVLSNVSGVETPHHFFSVYSINGTLLGNITLNHVVLDMCIVSDYLVTGYMNGTLQIRHVNDLSTTIVSKNVRSPIFTVVGSHNGSHIFIGLGDGNILVMCPSKSQ